MELTRRDAIAVLAGGGVVAGGATAALARDPDPVDEATLEGLTRTAEVLYPSAVSGIETFVRTYSLGRVSARPEYEVGVRRAVAALEDHARAWYDGAYTDLSADRRDELLRSLGVPTADPDPEGTTAERVRFYVVNELLYALYTSPAGGELVGLENPQGHPGGIESYREAE